MFFKSLLSSGWLHAMYISFISFPLGAVSQKFLVSYTDSNILVYTALFMVSSAVALLLIAGPGELAISTLRRVESWGYSFLQILSLIFFLLIIKYVSATEGAALGIMSGLFTLAFSFLFLRQSINKYEILGVIGILAGFYIIIDNANLPVETKLILVFVVLARAFFQGSQKLITEVHKTNRKAVSFKSQIRVTGFIMALAGFVFILFLLLMAAIKSQHNIEFLNSFPSFTDFIDLKVFILSVILGFFIVSISKFCEFYAGKTIGAKYLSSILSLHIIFVYLFEIILSKFDLLEPTVMTGSTLTALCLILLGNIVIAFSGFFKDLRFIKSGEQQDTLANLDDNFVDDEDDFNLVKLNVSNLLALYDHDSKKLATELDINRVILDNIANYEFGEFKLQNKIANKINNFASANVSTKDKLTKAYNRYFLEYQASELLKQNKDFKLYYLDLNKFKPVNDKYGHDAGDYVLAQTVSRLNEVAHFTNNVYRVGGDEFVLIQTSNLEKDLSDIIIKCIEQPISFKDIVLEISTSIGISISQDFNSFDEILNNADKMMFDNKHNK